MEVSRSLEGLGLGFSNKGPAPSLPCPNLPPSPRGHLQLILPDRLLPCQHPSLPHPPQGFQDLIPEFRSIFAQTKQEDGFNTSPCCRLSGALVSCSSKAGGHLWPPPSTSPASTDLAMQNERSQVIRGSLQILPQTSAWMKSPHLKPGEASGSRMAFLLDQACPPVAQGGCEGLG